MIDTYRRRPDFFAGVEKSSWQDWIWQHKNAVRSVAGLKKIFPEFPERWTVKVRAWERKGFRFLITPYVFSLVEMDKKGNPPKGDPIWRQVFPGFEGLRAIKMQVTKMESPDEYSFSKENWEGEKEMITPICQYKYDNRALIYISESCLGYCMYCFRSLQSCAKEEKHGGLSLWQRTLDEIRKRPAIEEVILSGGDPLVMANGMLGKLLGDIRKIKTVRTLRIHTRAWTHNPFRIDRGLCDLLKKHDVTVLGVHVVHPREITEDFAKAVERVRASGAKTMLLADIPLIRGVNDNARVLRELFMKLYLNGVKPYYLSHNMPNIPCAGQQRTSVRKGVELIAAIKRKISNPAMPEYVICHKSGKKTVPDHAEGTADFVYEMDENGWPVVRFKNWKGKWEKYVDSNNN